MDQQSPPSSTPNALPPPSAPSPPPAVVASTGEVRRLARAMERIAGHCGNFFVEVSGAIRRDRLVLSALLLALIVLLVAGHAVTFAELRALRREVQQAVERGGG